MLEGSLTSWLVKIQLAAKMSKHLDIFAVSVTDTNVLSYPAAGAGI